MPVPKRCSPFSLPDLPLEIYELIIDEYIANCNPSEIVKGLKNLSITSRNFHTICYPHLFSRIFYSYDHDHKDRGRFLQSSPHIVKLARNFELTFCHSMSEEDEERHIKDNIASSLCAELCTLKLKEISIETLCEPCDWGRLSPKLAANLARLILAPNLTSLFLIGIKNLPVGILHRLRQSRHITALALYDCTVNVNVDFFPAASVNDTEYSASFGCHLESRIMMGGINSPFKNPAIFKFSRLRCLVVGWTTSDDVEATRMIMKEAVALESFECLSFPHPGAGFSFEGLAECILYGPYRTLISLIIGAIPQTFEPNIDNPIPRIANELRKLANSNVFLPVLKRLHLDIESDAVDEDSATSATSVMHASCVEIEELLHDREAFPAAPQLKACIKISSPK
ncbi:hypothetical protein HYPSUDRAFT_77400 [Hypholoma sublateritium FD-334 SS-4]|uniref:F-box domain-containing protein n=1 Tax=Hypholoma sublateritium (strain FD-334 SS-4) TaxID=945553 RepID=A0A0D2P110_HYPSF|nr:hypothetical protein HYPSUDRAFT_77400 [Hypholoma sublateritium FD-334 SS-4]